MIRITIELVPPLVSGLKGKEIARAEIVNEGTGTKERGNYKYALWGKRSTAWRTGEVEDFPRKSYNVWHLLFKILSEIFK